MSVARLVYLGAPVVAFLGGLVAYAAGVPGTLFLPLVFLTGMTVGGVAARIAVRDDRAEMTLADLAIAMGVLVLGTLASAFALSAVDSIEFATFVAAIALGTAAYVETFRRRRQTNFRERWVVAVVAGVVVGAVVIMIVDAVSVGVEQSAPHRLLV